MHDYDHIRRQFQEWTGAPPKAQGVPYDDRIMQLRWDAYFAGYHTRNKHALMDLIGGRIWIESSEDEP